MPDWAVFDDKALARGFTIIPNLLWDLPLSGNAKFAYIVLLRHAWQDNSAYPSMDTIQAELSCSRTTAKAAIAELDRVGLIRREIRPGRTSVYRFRTLSETVGGDGADSVPPDEGGQNLTPSNSDPVATRPTTRSPGDQDKDSVNKDAVKSLSDSAATTATRSKSDPVDGTGCAYCRNPKNSLLQDLHNAYREQFPGGACLLMEPGRDNKRLRTLLNAGLSREQILATYRDALRDAPPRLRAAGFSIPAFVYEFQGLRHRAANPQDAGPPGFQRPHGLRSADEALREKGL